MYQVRLLPLLPASWSREKISREFGVSERQVRDARTLKETHGILPDVPKTNKGDKALPEHENQLVNDFYCDSDFVRIMPGSKQVVACRRLDRYKDYQAQRLIHCNLRELRGHFCSTYRLGKEGIGPSKFCGLRPKYCKIVTSNAAHSVCVCAYHQNF